MLISPQLFLPFYIPFLLIATYERITKTFFKKQTKQTQVIKYKWLYVVLLLSYIAIVLFSVSEYFLGIHSVEFLPSTVGLLIFSCGVWLRNMAMNDLGENWSNNTEIKEGHRLITTGIYHFLRHPYYFAITLELMGLCLLSNAYYSLILVFAIQAPLLLVRIFLEERMLIKHFGIQYKQYINHT